MMPLSPGVSVSEPPQVSLVQVLQLEKHLQTGRFNTNSNIDRQPVRNARTRHPEQHGCGKAGEARSWDHWHGHSSSRLSQRSSHRNQVADAYVYLARHSRTSSAFDLGGRGGHRCLSGLSELCVLLVQVLASGTVMSGPACLADAIAYGSDLPPR